MIMIHECITVASEQLLAFFATTDAVAALHLATEALSGGNMGLVGTQPTVAIASSLLLSQ